MKPKRGRKPGPKGSKRRKHAQPPMPAVTVPYMGQAHREWLKACAEAFPEIPAALEDLADQPIDPATAPPEWPLVQKP